MARDRRGAIVVLGAFMAPLLVGALYYVVSVANVLMQREGLQHDADAAAFTAAVVDARGMNAIAVINVLMSAVMGVVLPMRALQPAYAEIASRGCHHHCPCAIVADAARASAELNGRATMVEQQARDLLAALSDAQDAIAREAPHLGAEAATRMAARHPAFLPVTPRVDTYSPSLGPEGCRLGLPVEQDEFGRACRQAKPYVDAIAYRIANDTLHTIGACQSGLEALGIASRSLASPDNLAICRENAQPPCSVGGGSGPHPKKVFHEAKNGNDYMQIWSSLQGKPFDAHRSGVEVASYDTKGSDPMQELNTSFAQAEIYFDCDGSFGSSSCNGNEHAMWTTRWTARLRRVHKPEISFENDAFVKNTITDADHWNAARTALLTKRREPGTDGPAKSEASRTLLGAEEGPLQ
ncbi:hypothetical protein AKJ09_01424 [Labilithrix luteola]|uniref:Uncharacterized protein n=1 Tax=Labilithrix luteola TaxID=1391654 RepID=A0A0K1PMK4_9BACT|nr:hypothetical protein AKJ09_01424 [Labilithrix luteola]